VYRTLQEVATNMTRFYSRERARQIEEAALKTLGITEDE
jgi:DNA-directed RNA polymerase sigma subunit (sigma70/sigma32)